ncbi:MAG: hydroxypyruvate isomerase [Rhodospirillaceae bacterium]|nr:hydroxypyruvate isomerase [Rhodospirillaceae bacterium]
MPRFAANLSTMFGELPFLDRFAAAAAAGFKAVEVQEPYEHPADQVKAALDAAGPEMVLTNVPGGNAAAGDSGLAALPGRERDFAVTMETALAYAAVTGSPRLHVMSGNLPSGASINDCEEVLVSNLRMCARQAAAQGVMLLIEPINTQDSPGYIMSRQSQARRIVEAVAEDNVRIQFDFYHCQIMEGNLVRHFTEQLPLIGHIQISDNPGRHEPGTGEINYPFIFDAIDASGYDGWVGAEYRPKGETVEGLGWFEAARDR